MLPSDSPPIPVDLVDRVVDKLDTLGGELDAAANPHRIALRHLGMTNAFSGVKTPYSTEAQAIWADLLRRNPTDWESAHHLAITHHARAMDLELSPDPAKSNPEWAAAMDLWHMLWQADGFWESMAAMTTRTIGPDVWRTLREQLPTRLLTLHYDIAFDVVQARMHRAKHHLGLVRTAPYPAETKEAVQRDAYTRFISVVPAAVWQFEETNPETIKVGIDRIELFLAVDPTCVAALEDAVRLQARLLRAWITDLGAAGDDQRKRTRLLQEIRTAADHWRPYFDQMAGIPALDEEVRQKLGLWYRLMGDVHCALDQEETAVGYYEQGIRSTAPDDEEHRRCLNEFVETRALVARKLASNGKPNARSYCDEVRRRDDLTITAHFLLANAYVLLQDFDSADAVCEQGLSVEPQVSDIDEIEEHTRSHKRLKEMRSHIRNVRNVARANELLAQAMKLIQDHREAGALPLFDQAAALAPDLGMVYFLRCECHMTLLNVDAARKDLDTFRRLVDSKDGRDAAARLGKDLGPLAEQVGKFGREGLALRRQAIEAANAGQFERAATLFRQALAQCPRPGRQDLRHNLATVLTSHAIAQVNAIMESEATSHDAKKAGCREARGLLEEAARLDPGSAHISKNLADLNGLITQLDAAANATGTPEQLIEVFNYPGGEGQRQRFIEAVTSGRHDEATRLLLEAMTKRSR